MRVWTVSSKIILASAIFVSACSIINAEEGKPSEYTKKAIENAVIQDALPAQKQGEQKMSQLSDAVLEMDFSASEIAVSMGRGAISELKTLIEHEDAGVRMTAVVAVGALNLPEAHELLFQALTDEDSNVSGTAINKIEFQSSAIPAKRLASLLETVKEPNTMKRLVLLLGTRLELEQAGLLEPYCDRENDSLVIVACAAALSKIGVVTRQEQFANYLKSVSGTELNNAFDLVDYIGQPWLVWHLAHLLTNRDEIQSLGDAPPGFPKVLRVCDKAVPRIAALSGQTFSFPTNFHANYSDAQLKEVSDFAYGFRY